MSETRETPATDHLIDEPMEQDDSTTATDNGVRDIDPSPTPASMEDQTGDRATGLGAFRD